MPNKKLIVIFLFLFVVACSSKADLDIFRADGENIGLIIAKDPRNADAYNLRGISYARLSRLDKALNDFNQAIKLKKDFYQAYYNRGLISFRLQEYQKAMLDFDKALIIKKDYADAYIAKAKIFLARRRVQAALINLNKAIEAEPNNAEAYFIKGVMLQKQNKHARAYQELSSALALGYVNKRSLYHRVLSGLEMKYYSEVIEDLQSWIKIEPNNHKAYALLGFAHEKNKEYKKAQVIFSIALKIKPSYQFARDGINRMKKINNSYAVEYIENR